MFLLQNVKFLFLGEKASPLQSPTIGNHMDGKVTLPDRSHFDRHLK